VPNFLFSLKYFLFLPQRRLCLPLLKKSLTWRFTIFFLKPKRSRSENFQNLLSNSKSEPISFEIEQQALQKIFSGLLCSKVLRFQIQKVIWVLLDIWRERSPLRKPLLCDLFARIAWVLTIPMLYWFSSFQWQQRQKISISFFLLSIWSLNSCLIFPELIRKCVNLSYWTAKSNFKSLVEHWSGEARRNIRLQNDLQKRKLKEKFGNSCNVRASLENPLFSLKLFSSSRNFFPLLSPLKKRKKLIWKILESLNIH